jgi:site-specific recombinase XerD
MDRNESLIKFEAHLRRRFPERRTPVDYISDVRQFMAYCQKEWRDVTMQDIDAFVDQQRARGLKSSTVNRRVAALKTFFDFLAEECNDLSWPNPVRFKRHAGKRPRSLPRDLRDEDLERVWGVITSKRDRAWFTLMVRSGLRVGEVVQIQMGDLLSLPTADHPAKLRVRGKGEKERMVLLSNAAYTVLNEWLDERGERSEPHIFFNHRGHPMSVSGIEWLLHGYGDQVDVVLTPHQLRHTFARQITEAGMPVTSVGKLLGHSQITTTQIYTAGADPNLCQAFQQAMARVVDQTTLSHLPENPPDMLSPSPSPAPDPEPILPDWGSWATHLPAPIREASLDYIMHCIYSWPARRRRERTLNLLSELRNLWDWFLAHRTFEHPGELNYRDLLDYQSAHQQKGYAPSTINRRMDYILGIGRRLIDQNQTVDNSIFRLRYLPRPKSLPRHLSDFESAQLESFLLNRLHTAHPTERLENACLFLLLHSGLRAAECVDLRYQDLDLPGHRLIVRQGKGQRDRLVYLSDTACLAIQIYLQHTPRYPSDSLWLQPNGNTIYTSWLRDHVAAIGKAAGIHHLHPHRLRHTCATRLLNAGMEITSIQKLLGHELLSTTMIYARVQDTTLETHYKHAMQLIESNPLPFSNQLIPLNDWPSQIVKVPIDDSV